MEHIKLCKILPCCLLRKTSTIRDKIIPLNHICQICGRTFGRNWNKDRHLQLIHGLKPSNHYTLEIRNNPYHFNGYSKHIRANSRKCECPSSYFDQNQFPFRDLYRNNNPFKNNNDSFFNPYQNWFGNNIYEPEEDLDINHEDNLQRLCLKIKPRIVLVLNTLYSRNPYIPYTLPFRIYNYNVNKLIAFVTFRCISEKSTKPINRWVRKFGYQIA